MFLWYVHFIILSLLDKELVYLLDSGTQFQWVGGKDFLIHPSSSPDTCFVSHSSTVVWHHLPRDSSRIHRLGVWPTGLPSLLHSFRCQSPAQVVTGASGWLAADWRLPRPTPFLSSIHFPEWLTELRNNLLSRSPVHYKRIYYNSGAMRWKRRMRARFGERAQSFHALPRQPLLPVSTCSPTHRLSQGLLWGFYGGFVTQAGVVKSLASGNRFTLHSFSAPGGQGAELKVPTL